MTFESCAPRFCRHRSHQPGRFSTQPSICEGPRGGEVVPAQGRGGLRRLQCGQQPKEKEPDGWEEGERRRGRRKGERKVKLRRCGVEVMCPASSASQTVNLTLFYLTAMVRLTLLAKKNKHSHTKSSCPPLKKKKTQGK